MCTYEPITVVVKAGGAVTIRSAVESDAAAVWEHRRASYEQSHLTLIREPDEFYTTLDEQREWIAKRLASRNEVCLIALFDGRVAGMCSFHSDPRRKTAHSGLMGLSVSREWQNRGIGRALLQALTDWATENPIVERIGLIVVERNKRAIELYRRAGFVEEGRTVRAIKYADGTYADDVRMYKLVKKD